MDALSRKSSAILAHIRTTYVPLLMDMKIMGINLDYDGYEVTWLLHKSYLEVMDWLFPWNVLWFSIMSQVQYKLGEVMIWRKFESFG